mmetsp:Transcript_10594/g.21626  ORF Transcript_10594/g.21626 Transcript_10594/m.21626 type:complete len:285 (+) Transcript_10594:998-1852(+)
MERSCTTTAAATATATGASSMYEPMGDTAWPVEAVPTRYDDVPYTNDERGLWNDYRYDDETLPPRVGDYYAYADDLYPRDSIDREPISQATGRFMEDPYYYAPSTTPTTPMPLDRYTPSSALYPTTTTLDDDYYYRSSYDGVGVGVGRLDPVMMMTPGITNIVESSYAYRGYDPNLNLQRSPSQYPYHDNYYYTMDDDVMDYYSQPVPQPVYDDGYYYDPLPVVDPIVSPVYTYDDNPMTVVPRSSTPPTLAADRDAYLSPDPRLDTGYMNDYGGGRDGHWYYY